MKTLTITYLLLLGWVCASAQGGFRIVPGLRQVEIPFEYSNNFIILNIHFNATFPLKFIFDTGAENTILSKREITDVLGIPYEQEVRVKGSDLTTELIAYIVRGINLDIPRKITAPGTDILVLNEDYFRFEEYAGVDVHGILSASIFANYMIQIDFQRQILTLTDRSIFKLREQGYTGYDLEIFRNKLYMTTDLEILPDTVAKVKLLIDSGAGMPLLLFSNTHPLLAPPANALQSNIGMGLGGFLEGFIGRSYSLELGNYDQKGVITYFQTIDTSQNLSFLNDRNGLIGNEILSRFFVVLDYYDGKMWLKPNRSFSKNFVFDRSGITLIASGPSLKNYLVQHVLPNSPASEAGIQVGDEIKRVKWTPAELLSLGDIQRNLRKKPGTTVKLVIKRNGQKMKKALVLRELI